MTTLLQINDNNLRLQLADGRVISSQGYAWLKADSVAFDIDVDNKQAAVAQCRLNPQKINNRYWLQCDQSSIALNAMGLRHAADLVWQHLSQLDQKYTLNDLVMVVPSHYQEPQLQLLLGIAQASQISVTALVNKAVAELSKRSLSDGDYNHVDVQLHQTVCSKVIVSNGQCTLGDVQIIQDVGIHLMHEALLHGLQNVFIQDDRFDPLHDASTEQQLFDQLPIIANSISTSGNAIIGVEHQSRLHSISLESGTWNNFLNPFRLAIERLADDAKKSYLDLNGAFGSIELSGFDSSTFEAMHFSDSEDLTRFLKNNKDGDAVLYQTQLNFLNSPKAVDKTVEGVGELVNQPNQNSPTHLVLAGKAVPLNLAYIEHVDQSLKLHKKASGNLMQLLDDNTMFIIGGEHRQTLNVNDRIGSHLADGMLTVIQVL